MSSRAERRRQLKKLRKAVEIVCIHCGAVQDPIPVIDPIDGHVWFREPMKDYKRCEICGGSLQRRRKKE